MAQTNDGKQDLSKATAPDNTPDELDEILWQNIQFTELGNFPEAVPANRNWVNVMGKVYAFDFGATKAAIQQWGQRQRIDELKTLMAKHSRTYSQRVTDSNGDVYVSDSHGYISKYETQERLAALQRDSQQSGENDAQ